MDIRHAGDPVELAKRYVIERADELVFLDITATVDKRKTLVELVHRISHEINLPFTVGGGISSVADVRAVLNAGADKVSINSAAVKRPALINELSAEFGSQCVVLAIDAGLVGADWKVFVKGGRQATEIDVFDWAVEGEKRGAGEILLTSMQHDGTKSGFALELTNNVADIVGIPVIASGGAGNTDHFKDLFTQTNADAGLAASIFHFGEVAIPDLKQELRKNNVAVRI